MAGLETALAIAMATILVFIVATNYWIGHQLKKSGNWPARYPDRRSVILSELARRKAAGDRLAIAHHIAEWYLTVPLLFAWLAYKLIYLRQWTTDNYFVLALLTFLLIQHFVLQKRE